MVSVPLNLYHTYLIRSGGSGHTQVLSLFFYTLFRSRSCASKLTFNLPSVWKRANTCWWLISVVFSFEKWLLCLSKSVWIKLQMWRLYLHQVCVWVAAVSRFTSNWSSSRRYRAFTAARPHVCSSFLHNELQSINWMWELKKKQIKSTHISRNTGQSICLFCWSQNWRGTPLVAASIWRADRGWSLEEAR